MTHLLYTKNYTVSVVWGILMAIKAENIRIHITIPIKIYDKLEYESDSEDRSISKQITRILKERYNDSLDDDD